MCVYIYDAEDGAREMFPSVLTMKYFGYFLINSKSKYCSILDERPKRYRANCKQCHEEAVVPTGPAMYRRFFNRIVLRKRPA